MRAGSHSSPSPTLLPLTLVYSFTAESTGWRSGRVLNPELCVAVQCANHYTTGTTYSHIYLPQMKMLRTYKRRWCPVQVGDSRGSFDKANWFIVFTDTDEKHSVVCTLQRKTHLSRFSTTVSIVILVYFIVQL